VERGDAQKREHVADSAFHMIDMSDASAGIVPVIASRTEQDETLVHAFQQRRIRVVRP
jgi:hypothetical protein